MGRCCAVDLELMTVVCTRGALAGCMMCATGAYHGITVPMGNAKRKFTKNYILAIFKFNELRSNRTEIPQRF
jgi:hypothetical protein